MGDVDELAHALSEVHEHLPGVAPPPTSLLAESDLKRFDLFLAAGTILRDAAAERALLSADPAQR